MQSNKTLIALGVAAVMLAGCGKRDEAGAGAAAAEAAPAAAPASDEAQATALEPEAMPADPAAATPAAPRFDITTLPMSQADLPAWPYVALPAGYRFYNAGDLAGQSKDLARVPVWTGGQLLWVEGRSFSDHIRNDEGKTFSRFELRRNLQQSIEALGGVRLSERSYDNVIFEANRKELEDFRQEFSAMQGAYWYDEDVDTYVVRRPDKAIWLVLQARNDQASLLLAEGPLPQAGTAVE